MVFAWYSLKSFLDHEQTLTKNTLRAISTPRLLQEGWAHVNVSERHQMLMPRKMRAEAKIGGVSGGGRVQF